MVLLTDWAAESSRMKLGQSPGQSCSLVYRIKELVLHWMTQKETGALNKADQKKLDHSGRLIYGDPSPNGWSCFEVCS